MESDRCLHELLIEQCSYCKLGKDGIPDIVYVTKGGAVFHKRSDCELLISGQHFAYSLGFLNHPINPVHRSSVAELGRCEWCFASLDRKFYRACQVYYRGNWANALLIRTRELGHGKKEYLVQFKNGEGKIIEKGIRESNIRL